LADLWTSTTNFICHRPMKHYIFSPLFAIFFPVLAAIAIFGCGSTDWDDLPCLTCGQNSRCGNGGWYDASTQFCADNTVYNKCNGVDYNPLDRYCFNGSTLRDYGYVSYYSKTYKTVLIGIQTWMTENLNYDVEGSKCYGEGEICECKCDYPCSCSAGNKVCPNYYYPGPTYSTDEIQGYCNKYGRLYDWYTAMDLPSKCKSKLSTTDTDCGITMPKHKGICPTGWHIPSDAEWDVLMTAVGGVSIAARYLKATSGWDDVWYWYVGNIRSSYYYSDCGPGNTYSYQCEDKYGFSALPGGSGGYGNSFGNFGGVGEYGKWWSASENDSHAYGWRMSYDDENVYRDGNSDLQSVRCLQD